MEIAIVEANRSEQRWRLETDDLFGLFAPDFFTGLESAGSRYRTRSRPPKVVDDARRDAQQKARRQWADLLVIYNRGYAGCLPLGGVAQKVISLAHPGTVVR